PGEPDRDRALRDRRLLAHARPEVRVRAAQPLGDGARDRLDLALEPLVDDERAAGGGGDELDRAVVVRRAEAAGDEQQVGAQTVRDRLPQLGGAVADDRDRARLEPERDRLASVE